jgi:hypothetical protein
MKKAGHCCPAFSSLMWLSLPRVDQCAGSASCCLGVSIAATRFFTAFCTFSKARTSIWRTRSRETPKRSGEFLQRDRIVGFRRRSSKMMALALVQHAEGA